MPHHDHPIFCAGCGRHLVGLGFPRAFVDGHRGWHFGCAMIWRGRRDAAQPVSIETRRAIDTHRRYGVEVDA